MKMIRRIGMTAAALIFIASSVFAQSLADAKKAIDAEQYQKAKSMLKNLTTTQPTKDENFFYLGWVYLIQDYADSAQVEFNKGIAANPKSALNFAGLGAAAKAKKDAANAKLNFDKAIAAAGKDSKPYVYAGRAYLLENKVPAEDANAAIAILEKGKTINPKDAELQVALGDAYLAVLKSNDAYKNYSDALTIDPKYTRANVALGKLWIMANNWESAEGKFKDALAIDPNYGPAYREWAEANYRQAQTEPKNASVKIKEAVEHYQKFMSLTDNSIESQMRYADFLINAGDYKTLQQVATSLTKYANTNLRVYRYIAYAALENKDYQNGITAANKFINEAGEKRVIPRDYLVLGRLQIGAGNDSLGIQNLRKAYQLDTAQADVFAEIAKSYYGQKKYVQAGDAYMTFTRKGGRAVKLTDYYYAGLSYYYGYDDKKANADSLLTKADSAFSYIIAKTATAPFADAYLYRARVNDLKEKDRNNIQGLAKPYYEKYIEIQAAKTGLDDRGKKNLAEGYAYMGTLAEFKDKDDAKAAEFYGKARENDPANKSAQSYFSRKSGGAGKGK